MGSPTIKLTMPDGTVKETAVEDVSFKGSEEPWSVYELEDGSKARVRPFVVKVLRTAEFDSQGNPIYQILISNVVFVDVADNLKRKDRDI